MTMDVTVSHLNNRLALQLPAQLPLGLVFVLGDVDKLWVEEDGRSKSVTFELEEKGHRVHCRLSPRAAEEFVLQNGDKIRAGGHLAFDSTRAGYFLLVRDIEVVQAQSANPLEMEPIVERSELVSVLAVIEEKPGSSDKAADDLPAWVKELAPPEYQAELKKGKGGETAVSSRINGDSLNTEQLARLSAAMDSDEDVELTDSLLEIAKKLNQARGVSGAEPARTAPASVAKDSTSITDIEDPDAYKPTGSKTSERILLLVVIVALALFLLIVLAFVTGIV